MAIEHRQPLSKFCTLLCLPLLNRCNFATCSNKVYPRKAWGSRACTGDVSRECMDVCHYLHAHEDILRMRNKGTLCLWQRRRRELPACCKAWAGLPFFTTHGQSPRSPKSRLDQVGARLLSRYVCAGRFTCVSRVLAAAPQTPLPNGILRHPCVPWYGPMSRHSFKLGTVL
jgi:hypothetical protein